MSYQVHQYKHRRPSTEQQIVEGIFKGLWWIISLPFRLIFGKKRANYNKPENAHLTQEFYHSKWQEIDTLMQLGRPSNFSRAVLEADKLLDHILKSFRVPGTTMGERLKAAKNRFSPEGYNAAWQAHKVRNELVHSAEYQITDFIARGAIANFKKAMGELI